MFAGLGRAVVAIMSAAGAGRALHGRASLLTQAVRDERKLSFGTNGPPRTVRYLGRR